VLRQHKTELGLVAFYDIWPEKQSGSILTTLEPAQGKFQEDIHCKQVPLKATAHDCTGLMEQTEDKIWQVSCHTHAEAISHVFPVCN